MTSLVAKTAARIAGAMRTVGASLDGMGKQMEVLRYTEKLVPSTRFVAVDGVAPKVDPQSFVAPSASVIGDVTLGKTSSVWYGATVRGDVNKISIGNCTNILDRAVVHVAKIQGDHPTHIGNHVTIGAGALVHAATLGDAISIGEGAQVMDGAAIGSHCIIEAGSVVTPGTKVPSGELWAGSPAQKVRALTEEEKVQIVKSAIETSQLANMHALETSKTYDQVIEDATNHEIDETIDWKRPPPTDENMTILDAGMPGLIFRNTLSHPYDGKEFPDWKKYYPNGLNGKEVFYDT